MDTHAARRARRKAIQTDLAQAYTDEEACPPEWLDLQNAINETSAAIAREIRDETTAFVHEPDIKRALARRERTDAQLRDRIAACNEMVRRLNLIAPHQRFTRPALDAEALLRPLFRSPRLPRSL